MQQSLTITIYIQGMYCRQCEDIIAIALLNTRGVLSAEVSYWRSQAKVEYESEIIDSEALSKAIKDAGYHVCSSRWDVLIGNFIVVCAVILLFFLIKNTNFSSFLLQVDPSVSMGVIFIVGLLTSFHCLGMCGGIMLTQTTATNIDCKGFSRKSLLPSLSYNIGRIISYTLIGGIVGALGKELSFSTSVKGAIVSISGILMLIIGVQMLGLIPGLRRLPNYLPSFCGLPNPSKKLFKNKPLIIGLLNGFMPCGPLQAMQLYALGTGDFTKGALSMFVFSIGTIPLMFTFGALSSFATKRFSKYMIRVSAVLIVALSLVMITRGFSVSGITLMSNVSSYSYDNVAKLQDGTQVVNTIVDKNGYTTREKVIRKEVPVRWILQGEVITDCNKTITVPELGVEAELHSGENIVYFTPTEEGKLVYACWMGMLTGSFTVVK